MARVRITQIRDLFPFNARVKLLPLFSQLTTVHQIQKKSLHKSDTTKSKFLLLSEQKFRGTYLFWPCLQSQNCVRPLFSSPMHSHPTNTSIFLSPTVNTSIYLHPELYEFRRTGTHSATLYYLLWYLSTTSSKQKRFNQNSSCGFYHLINVL
jgi:hypothetical protein